MVLKKGQFLNVCVDDMAFGGKGVAHVDGFALFVDQSVPLDHVTAQVIKKKKKFAQARVIKLIEASPFRKEPLCSYSGYCGGCKWQFIKYEKQLEYKKEHVIDLIEHVGLIKKVTVHDTISSQLVYGYRNKMEFSCSDRKWLLPNEMDDDNVDKGFALGLHVPGTFNKVLDISSCMLQPELGNKICEDVRKFIKSSKVPVYGLRSHKGFWRFLVLRHSVAYDHWMVNIVTASEDLSTVQPLADLLKEKYHEVVSVVNSITSRKASVAVGECEFVLAGESVINEKIGQYKFEISANSFFQTNSLGAKKLYEIVAKYAELTGDEVVLDLYCGIGTISIYLSKNAKMVVGIEVIKSAVDDAMKNCLKNNISNCRFIHGDIRYCLSEIDISADVMIIDPPRAGMHKDVVLQILNLAPEKIVYVSCNPATMARDLSILKDSYKVLEVQPIDMFPHTHHIESVLKLEKF